MVKFVWVKRAGVLLAACIVAAIASPAQTFTIVHDFGTGSGDGAFPSSELIQGVDGNLYGTTQFGGAMEKGTAYKLSPSGTLTVLYNFCVQTICDDGGSPYAGLVQTADGNLFGTTYDHGPHGWGGSIFEITPAGGLSTLYGFCNKTYPACTDGASPQGLLVATGTETNFFGTTRIGGDNSVGAFFRVTPSGEFKRLYSFGGQSSEPAFPHYGPLVQGMDGNFYGTTLYGGAKDRGTVFKITPTGTMTILHSFEGPDGDRPYAGLVEDANGNLYGTTSAGGATNYGTVFKISPSGSLSTLYSFCSVGDCVDGANPVAAPIQGSDGNFYGTTQFGGVQHQGTIFKITPSGTQRTIHTFCVNGRHSGCPDGAGPWASLVQDTDGKFYGTTFGGGVVSMGTVFSLATGLDPFVKPQTTSGKSGASVNILGTKLTGATSVTFNGLAAQFTVVSASEITATVPFGATTGPIQVVTPGATLTSNVPFRVQP